MHGRTRCGLVVVNQRYAVRYAGAIRSIDVERSEVHKCTVFLFSTKVQALRCSSSLYAYACSDEVSAKEGSVHKCAQYMETLRCCMRSTST
jgi:hypothetical protein